MNAPTSPTDSPETESDFFERIAVEMAQLEFCRNLRRDQPQLFGEDRASHRACHLDMLTRYYLDKRTAIASGRTMHDRMNGYAAMHELLMWTLGAFVYAGIGADGHPLWRAGIQGPDDGAGDVPF